MRKPSVSIHEWMENEIDDRRHSRTDRSKWIREAILVRFYLENSGDWESVLQGAEKGDFPVVGGNENPVDA